MTQDDQDDRNLASNYNVIFSEEDMEEESGGLT